METEFKKTTAKLVGVSGPRPEKNGSGTYRIYRFQDYFDSNKEYILHFNHSSNKGFGNLKIGDVITNISFYNKERINGKSKVEKIDLKKTLNGLDNLLTSPIEYKTPVEEILESKETLPHAVSWWEEDEKKEGFKEPQVQKPKFLFDRTIVAKIATYVLNKEITPEDIDRIFDIMKKNKIKNG